MKRRASQPGARSAPRAARRGLTLLEMTLALSVTAMVALAMAGVMTAVSRSMSYSGSARSALQRAHAAHHRLTAYTNTGLCVADHDENQGFVVWLSDDNGDDRMNLLELRLFRFEQDAGNLMVERVELPEGWDQRAIDQANISLSMGSNLFDAFEAQRDLGNVTAEYLADGVSDWELEYTADSVEEATRLRLTLELPIDENAAHTVLLAPCLPNHHAPES